ncbi:hypothetical protein [Corynebacterium terpenotabidum]|nr:hypothetical protein [Corynebacterium terpenotabidum]
MATRAVTGPPRIDTGKDATGQLISGTGHSRAGVGGPAYLFNNLDEWG